MMFGDERDARMAADYCSYRGYLGGVRVLVGAEHYADTIWKGREVEQRLRNAARARAWERDRLREVSP